MYKNKCGIQWCLPAAEHLPVGQRLFLREDRAQMSERSEAKQQPYVLPRLGGSGLGCPHSAEPVEAGPSSLKESDEGAWVYSFI